jgi:hypothetical protein
LDRKGRTVATTDLLIAAASYKMAKVLHLDTDFEVIASFVDLERGEDIFPRNPAPITKWSE